MVGNPSRTPQPAVDENPLSLPKRCKSLLIEEVREAGHQEATVVVTSFKIIKFLVKSGFREEAGLGIAAGKGTCGMRWTGMRGNGQRLSPIVEGREEGAKGLRGAGRGVSGKGRLLDWDRKSWLRLLPLLSGFIRAAFAQPPPS